MPKKGCTRAQTHKGRNAAPHAVFLPLCSFAFCSASSIFSRSSAEMPSAGLIKAASSCSHRIGMLRLLAAPPAGRLNHTRRRESQLRLGHQRPQLPSRSLALIIHLSFNYALIYKRHRSADCSNTCSFYQLPFSHAVFVVHIAWGLVP